MPSTLTIPALTDQPIIWLQGGFHIDSDTTPAFPKLDVEFAGPLKPLTEFMTILKDIASVLSPGSGSHVMQAHAAQAHDDSTSGSDAGLQVHFADGKLSVTDNFTLPDLPLGPGTISDVSLDIGATLDIVGLAIGFMVSIGTLDAPCHWIVDPLSGTVAVGAGVKNNEIDIFILGGIGVGLGDRSRHRVWSASIVLSVSVEINGSHDHHHDRAHRSGRGRRARRPGQCIHYALRRSRPQFAIPPTDVNLIGTASVGIHISICWIINIDFSGSWTFQKDIPLHQLHLDSSWSSHMAGTPRNLTLMLFPQRWDGHNLDVNLLLLPNGDPTAQGRDRACPSAQRSRSSARPCCQASIPRHGIRPLPGHDQLHPAAALDLQHDASAIYSKIASEYTPVSPRTHADDKRGADPQRSAAVLSGSHGIRHRTRPLLRHRWLRLRAGSRNAEPRFPSPPARWRGARSSPTRCVSHSWPRRWD